MGNSGTTSMGRRKRAPSDPQWPAPVQSSGARLLGRDWGPRNQTTCLADFGVQPELRAALKFNIVIATFCYSRHSISNDQALVLIF